MAGNKRETPRIQPFVASCHVVDGIRRFAAYLTDLSLAGLALAANPARWLVSMLGAIALVAIVRALGLVRPRTV